MTDAELFLRISRLGFDPRKVDLLFCVVMLFNTGYGRYIER
jgi:hypothetical protein